MTTIPEGHLQLAIDFPHFATFIASAWILGYTLLVTRTFLEDLSPYGEKRRRNICDTASYVGDGTDAIRQFLQAVRAHYDRNGHSVEGLL